MADVTDLVRRFTGNLKLTDRQEEAFTEIAKKYESAKKAVTKWKGAAKQGAGIFVSSTQSLGAGGVAALLESVAGEKIGPIPTTAIASGLAYGGALAVDHAVAADALERAGGNWAAIAAYKSAKPLSDRFARYIGLHRGGAHGESDNTPTATEQGTAT